MRPADPVANCPFDGCPMRPFKLVKAPPGWTIALHGCRFCNFNRVVAVAGDAGGRRRMVAEWSVDPASGLYILVKEYGHNPPAWLDLTCAALPQREPT